MTPKQLTSHMTTSFSQNMPRNSKFQDISFSRYFLSAMALFLIRSYIYRVFNIYINRTFMMI